ncbi:CDP-alcohol phosphatidyltransferase family protein [soil metagenome]
MSASRNTASSNGAAWSAGLVRDAARDLSTAAAAVLSSAVAIEYLAGFGPIYVLKVSVLFAVCAWFVWRGLPAAHPHSRLGAANRITLGRLGVAALLAAIIGQQMARPDAVAWGIFVVATIAALLDLMDGYLARRSGLASDFGARFDMETDAWFTLVLCSLVVFFGKAGPWVLAAGLMRYAFVGASRFMPWLSAPLPPSTRRKAVCVTQITTLIVCLGPIIPVWASTALAGISLAMLTWSFAVDVRALAAHRPGRV